MNEKLITRTKASYVLEIAEKTGIHKRDVSLIITSFINAMTDSLVNNERIELRGLGVLKNKKRRARIARNPRTGEKVRVDERLVPTYKPSSLLKRRINKVT
ncbi:integration host factor subunit beta [candidate division WOR-3 bacterium]|nr:integration host factor subunit beta [candidate division WOR-3 bacterium]MCK4585189.1 integration host factor subunit beta [candidate division WOR-3 bacterium]TET76960.1 MAG: integration host factor subunit beta [Candidatus Cloacimonadota bacterium]